VYDNAPEQSGRSGHHATLSLGIRRCITRSIKDMIHCLGGIQVLFPLFAHLDIPVLQHPTNASVTQHSIKPSFLEMYKY
jgi:hypothetical protein